MINAMSTDRPGLSPLPLPPRAPSGWRGLAVAVPAALLYGLVIYGLTRWQAPNSGMLLLAFLLGAPMAACVIAVAVADPKIGSNHGLCRCAVVGD